MNRNERFSFFVSSKRFLATLRTVDRKEEEAEAEDRFDEEEEDLTEEEEVEEEEEEADGIPLAVSLCFRSRFAFFHVWSFVGKHAMKIPMKDATKAAMRKPIHQSPTQFGCAGVMPLRGSKEYV